ncbi:hypothetical protein [Oleiharenicola lentus]|uniref:hypothetical protein n=1 Tax=Oleiharenicola lentus TaxID=2508720 RepID=UPI003F67ACE8
MFTRLSACALALLLVTSGCKDREIVSYRAPKDPAAAPMPSASAPNTNDLPAGHPPTTSAAAAPAPMMPAASGDQMSMANTAVPTGSDSLKWSAPSSWAAMPQRPMRKATFAIKGDAGADADLSITSFPGDTGGLLANINRWRGQIALSPLAQAQLDANVQHLDIGSLHVDVVDFLGTMNGTPTRVLGAIIPHQSDTWFFKVTGPDALVAREKEAFMAFLKTISPR